MSVTDGAKEATSNDFKPKDMRDKIMLVLVKASKLTEKKTIVFENEPPEPQPVLEKTKDGSQDKNTTDEILDDNALSEKQQK